MDLTLRHAHIDVVEGDDITEDFGDAAASHRDGCFHASIHSSAGARLILKNRRVVHRSAPPGGQLGELVRLVRLS
ncbi:hypothetical protein [Kitasatospora sp. MAP5-34]|uniref:hypothetical protein n=1 Tax=Kitasatospora sp. MAP5-34 TaxID=3035102 RepID=UPI0024764386|nr:hypothetical protein [Kitasatospora sp. MAP5-34]